TAQSLEHVFELKRSLKQMAYRPVVALKRTGQLELRLRSLRKQFLIPRHHLDKIFLETKKIENFILEEFFSYSEKLHRIYRSVLGFDSGFSDLRNISMQFTLFEKQITSFDQTVQTKLDPIQDLIHELETICNSFEDMAKKLSSCFDIFFLVPGELGIGYFSDIDLKKNRSRKKTIDLAITTDRIVMLQNKRYKVFSNKAIIFDEFPPEDLIDVQKSNSGFFKRDELSITTIQQDYILRAESTILLRIFDSLQVSYYGRPSELYIYEPFRDWSSENYQEKILNALNFQIDSSRDAKIHSETPNQHDKDPEFVIGVLQDRLRDLRIRKLANEKALQELKEGRKKVHSREYFDLVRQFELELAKLNEEITELLIRTGKTNIL
ncbi:hypothetical protein, partial [Candidatus Hodarchaeum mangrovi]